MIKGKKLLIIICIIIAIVVIVIGIAMAITKSDKPKHYLEPEMQWMEEQYDFDNPDNALKEIQKHYKDSVRIVDESIEGCWLYTSETPEELYIYCKETKMFGFMDTVVTDDTIIENEEE